MPVNLPTAVESLMPQFLILAVILGACLVVGILLAVRLSSKAIGNTQNEGQQKTVEAIGRLEQNLRQEDTSSRAELQNLFRTLSETQANHMQGFTQNLFALLKANEERLASFQTMLGGHLKETSGLLEKSRITTDARLKEIQEQNEKKLEQMRQTVEEKLQQTVEKRFAESFKMISDRLEQVHKGLGEMQVLANGVGDLKKVLSNVKTRGVLGEYQLAALLEQLLTPDQYGINVRTKPDSRDHVEFAIKLPGSDGTAGKPLWMPLDSKFPTEDYHSLLDAYESGNVELIETLKKSMTNRLKTFAKDIRDKYLEPPYTTDFGILFLPFEGLYAEVLRIPGIFEMLQRDYKVILTGPTTLAALLNSLQMGFKTLAIEKRSSEVWQLLGTVKNEFSVFGDVLEKTHKKLTEAQNVLDQAGRRSRSIERKLRDVELLPETPVEKLLGETAEGLPPTTDDLF